MKKERDDQKDEIELPQEIIQFFARFLVPEIRKYYESEAEINKSIASCDYYQYL